MAQVLKVGDRDFSTFIQNAHDAGLDPANSEYSEPQFSGAPAFTEGQTFVGDAISNRLQSYPLILKAANTDALYQLVRDINGGLKKGEQVEYRSGGASQSTFFDLERGRLEITFEFWLDQSARARCMLHLWTRPLGHTGTTRLIASLSASGPALVPLASVAGDYAANAVLGVRVASVGQNGQRNAAVLYGLRYPTASGFNPVVSASAFPTGMAAAYTPGATTVGASGRIASQYKAWAVQKEAALNQSLTEMVLRNQDAGRYRLFLVMRHFVQKGASNSSLVVQQYRTTPTTAISLGSVLEGKWQLVDGGEFAISEEKTSLNIGYRHASGRTFSATYPIQIDTAVMVPIDQQAGVQLTRSADFSADRWRVEINTASSLSRLWGSASAPSKWASAVAENLTARLRGDLLKLPPIPSGAPSGPANLLVFPGYISTNESGEGLDWVGSMPYDIDLSVRERFTYLR